jgi:hypothetical protein
MSASGLIFYAIFFGGIACLSHFITGRGSLPWTAHYRERKAAHLEQICLGLDATSLKLRWAYHLALYWACLFIAFCAINFWIFAPFGDLYSPEMSDSTRALAYLAYPSPLAIGLYFGAVKMFRWRRRRSRQLLKKSSD